jgi:RND family efflux transporter MFP subunit
MYKLGIILVMATAFACGGPQQPGTDRTQGAHTHGDDGHNNQAHGADVRDGHLHDTEAIQSTLFSEQTEFFIEYEPLEAGKESAFLVHVTNLQSYRPYTAGSLTITAGGQQVTAEAPARPGIFEVPFVPKSTGKQTISYTLQSGELKTSVSTHAFVSAHHHEGGESDGSHQHDETDPVGSHQHEGDDSHQHDEAEPEGSHQHKADGSHEHDVEDATDSHLHEEAGGSHQHEALYSGTTYSETSRDEASHAEEGEIIFLKEQAWKTDFMVQPVHRAPFSSVLKASGEIVATPSEKTGLSAATPGILLFRHEKLVPGTHVEKGEPLFIITPATPGTDNLTLQFNELKNSLNQSRSEFLRHHELFAANVIPERQFIETKTAYTADSLRFYNLASMASENGLTVTAPATGYIHELHVTQGQFVQTGLQLATISANRNLLLRADLPLQHYAMAQQIVTANFRTSYSPRIYRVDELSGALLSRGTSVSGNDHFIPLYFSIINDGTLLEGAYVELFLLSEEQENTLVVPVTALTEELSAFYCYVQVTGESFTKRSVQPGRSDGSRVEITGGLHPGERVVTEGAMLLKAASMVVGETGHGHAH